MISSDAPRISGNDWSSLPELPLGSWTPKLAVSVVIPAYQAQDTLAYTLASLTAQTYPEHLLEVLVVDDGSNPPVTLPEVRPENTRVVRPDSSWGRANACREGALAADGDVLHWLDADMVTCRDQVEAQMRWHHQLDSVVVLGHKRFVDTEDLPEVPQLLDAVRSDKLAELFAGRWIGDHAWVEAIWSASTELQRSGTRAFHVHVGSTASVGRGLYMDSGGMDPTLKLGEDIELGYRLAMKGGVFVADRQARNWHLGRTMLMRHEHEVQRYNRPFIADRIPAFRKMRQERGRMYTIPFVEIVIDASAHSFDLVKYTVDGCLRTPPGDVRCVLLADWSGLDDQRRDPLSDPLLDLRLLRAEYGSDARVTFATEVATTPFPATFRLHLPAGWRPGRAVAAATKEMQNDAQGLRWYLLPDGQVARLESTAAFERAMRVCAPDEDVDDVVDQVAGSWWCEGIEAGFTHPTLAPPSGHHKAAEQVAGRPEPSQVPFNGSGAEEPPHPAIGSWKTLRRVRRAVRRPRS